MTLKARHRHCPPSPPEKAVAPGGRNEGVPLTSPHVLELGPDDARFGAWCEVWTASELADRPDDPPRPASDHVAHARQLLAPGGSRDGTHRAAVLGDAVVGALRLLLPIKENVSVAIVDVAVHPEYRRQGIGRTLLDDGIRLARARGRTKLIAEVDEPAPGTAGRQFAVRHGWTCDLTETRRDLLVPPDEPCLNALEAEVRKASTGYQLLSWQDRTPDALLEDRALLERRMTIDAPHGDLPVQEEHWDSERVREYETSHLARGRTVLSAGAVKNGQLVAFTDLQIPLAHPQHARQGGTLVLREHRGHRLGCLVKTAVLRELAAAVPAVRRISTTNAEHNAPMVAINQALGFVPVGQLSTWSLRL